MVGNGILFVFDILSYFYCCSGVIYCGDWWYIKKATLINYSATLMCIAQDTLSYSRPSTAYNVALPLWTMNGIK